MKIEDATNEQFQNDLENIGNLIVTCATKSKNPHPSMVADFKDMVNSNWTQTSEITGIKIEDICLLSIIKALIITVARLITDIAFENDVAELKYKCNEEKNHE